MDIIPGLFRKKYIPRRIDSNSTFGNVWEQLELLNNEANVKNILKRSIDVNFYNLNLKHIKTQRKQFFGNLNCSPKRFIKNDEIDGITQYVLTSLKQAKEYYIAAKSASSLTKPVFLYYGMISFAKAIIKSTYYLDKNPKRHGLRVEDDLNVKILRCGEFQIFHDCYMADASVYTNDKLEVSLKELLSVIPGIATEWEFAYEGIPKTEDIHKFRGIGNDDPFKNTLETSIGEFEVHLKRGLTKNDRMLHIIDIHILAMFIPCSFARYKPLKWRDTIEKSTDINSFLINAFLRHSELDFPMLIYSELIGIKTFFMPLPRMV
ncbi:MAG: YaaC family protein [Methanobacterium sp.]|jgi:hypothetical protein